MNFICFSDSWRTLLRNNDRWVYIYLLYVLDTHTQNFNIVCRHLYCIIAKDWNPKLWKMEFRSFHFANINLKAMTYRFNVHEFCKSYILHFGDTSKVAIRWRMLYDALTAWRFSFHTLNSEHGSEFGVALALVLWKLQNKILFGDKFTHFWLKWSRSTTNAKQYAILW